MPLRIGKPLSGRRYHLAGLLRTDGRPARSDGWYNLGARPFLRPGRRRSIHCASGHISPRLCASAPGSVAAEGPNHTKQFRDFLEKGLCPTCAREAGAVDGAGRRHIWAKLFLNALVRNGTCPIARTINGLAACREPSGPLVADRQEQDAGSRQGVGIGHIREAPLPPHACRRTKRAGSDAYHRRRTEGGDDPVQVGDDARPLRAGLVPWPDRWSGAGARGRSGSRTAGARRTRARSPGR